MAKKMFSEEESWEQLKSYGGGSGSYSHGGGSQQAYAPRCYTTHPALPMLALNGVTYHIYGGSCSSPVVHDADIYIGFDHMRMTHPHFPWNPPDTAPVLEVHFPITDMCAPHNAGEFKKMITWVCNQLQEGKKIHAGCIGGHGRTGTFLAAVVAELTGEKDAITYVRDHYCKKAVESHSQIEFLAKHYGIKKIAGSKEYSRPQSPGSPSRQTKIKAVSAKSGGKASGKTWLDMVGSADEGGQGQVVEFPRQKPLSFSNSTRTIAPVPSKRCLWNRK